MKKVFILIIMCFLAQFVTAQESDVIKRIKKKFPNAEITKSEVKYHYKEEYVIKIDQWIDHEDHSLGTFKQRMFLSHYDRKAPMLIVTEGYQAGPRHYELTDILMSNQLIVEYRFFGESVPTTIDYQYLTNNQAVKDLHRIKKAFKRIYRKEWISTGISKGGTTCMYYKAAYPRDVKVAIPYVAPLPNAREDIRTDEAIMSVGDKVCKEKLYAFQKAALMLQDSMLDMAKEKAKETKLTFNTIGGIEKSLEYAVLEYTFSFYQMGYNCEDVPVKPTAQQAFDQLMSAVGIDFYSDGIIEYYKPSFYQFMTQNGYYGFMHEHLDDLLKYVKTYDNAIFAPQGVSLEYDPSYNIEVTKRLRKKGKRMIYIQGEYDPWGALTFVPSSDQDALLMVKKGGSHRTRIKDFDSAEKNKMYDALDRWLRAEIHRK